MTYMLTGAGIWLRRTGDLRPELAAEHLRFVVIQGQVERGPINRGPAWREWAAAFRALGGELAVMDWLPSPDRAPTWLEPLADYAVRLGARVLMTDTEHDAGWRQTPLARVRRYAAELHRVARERGLTVAVTDYGSGGIGTARLRILLGENGIAVPQSYDPNDPDGSDPKVTHHKSMAYWTKAGAVPERTVKGLGIWLRSERRHRTAAELAGHTTEIPEGIPAVCAWYGTTSDAPAVLERSLPVLSAWVASRAPLAPTEPPPALPPILDPAPSWRASAAHELEHLAERGRAAGDVAGARVIADAAERLRVPAC